MSVKTLTNAGNRKRGRAVPLSPRGLNKKIVTDVRIDQLERPNSKTNEPTDRRVSWKFRRQGMDIMEPVRKRRTYY